MFKGEDMAVEIAEYKNKQHILTTTDLCLQ